MEMSGYPGDEASSVASSSRSGDGGGTGGASFAQPSSGVCELPAYMLSSDEEGVVEEQVSVGHHGPHGAGVHSSNDLRAMEASMGPVASEAKRRRKPPSADEQAPLNIAYRSPGGWTALHVCAVQGDTRRIIALLGLGADVDDADNDYKTTALHLAIGNGHVGAAEALIVGGADLNWADAEGYRPCHTAALSDSLACLHLLHVKGARLTVQDNRGRTALHGAAMAGSFDCAVYLMRNGLDMASKDMETMSSVHYAAAGGKFSIIRYMMLHGANMDDPGPNGMTPMAVFSAQHTALASQVTTNAKQLKESENDLEGVKSLKELIPLAPPPNQVNRTWWAIFFAVIVGELWVLWACINLSVLCIIPAIMVYFWATYVQYPLFFSENPIFETSTHFAHVVAVVIVLESTYWVYILPICIDGTTGNLIAHMLTMMLSGMLVYWLWKCRTDDVGVITPNSANSPSHGLPWEELNGVKMCPTCVIAQPIRSHHCSFCDVCVSRFDHHCIWIGKCVGWGNHFSFGMFTASCAVAQMAFIMWGLWLIWDVITWPPSYDIVSLCEWAVHIFDADPVVVVVSLYSLPTTYFTSILALSVVTSIAFNVNTAESYSWGKRPWHVGPLPYGSAFYRSFKANAMEFFNMKPYRVDYANALSYPPHVVRKMREARHMQA